MNFVVDVWRPVFTWLLLFALQVRWPQLQFRYFESSNTFLLRSHKVCPVGLRNFHTVHVSFSAFPSQGCF